MTSRPNRAVRSRASREPARPHLTRERELAAAARYLGAKVIQRDEVLDEVARSLAEEVGGDNCGRDAESAEVTIVDRPRTQRSSRSGPTPSVICLAAATPPVSARR